MYDYIFLFANAAAAQADPSIGAYWVAPTADNPTGSWRGDVCYPGMKILTATAIVNGVSTLTGFWIGIASMVDVPAFDAHSKLVAKLDRDAAIAGATAGLPASPKTISSITVSGNTATVTTALAHGLITGSAVNLTGVLPTQYNGNVIVTVISSTVFTFPLNSLNLPTGPATSVGAYTGILPGTCNGTFVLAGGLTGAGRSNSMMSSVPLGAMYPQPLGQ